MLTQPDAISLGAESAIFDTDAPFTYDAWKIFATSLVSRPLLSPNIRRYQKQSKQL